MSDDHLKSLGFDEEDPAEPRPRRARRSRKPVVILVSALVLLLIVPIAAIGLYAHSIERSFTQNLRRDPALTVPEENRPTRAAANEGQRGPVNFLLMGSDDRGDGNGGRSDALMLLHLSADRTSSYIISFPRDLYVEIPGHGRNKINAAYAFGGPSLSVRTVEQLLEVRIDHVAQIDMDGFIGLTTELGGVTVQNAHFSRTGRYVFPEGEITISGDEALAYVRERHQLPRGDLDRAERQRDVVQAIIRKGLSTDVISDPARFTSFIGAAARNMSVDDGLTDAEVRKLALSLRMTPNDVVTLEVPTRGTGMAGAMSIVIADEAGIADLATHVRNDTLSDWEP